MSALPVRPSRPPAPPLPDFDKLDQTHARILEALDQFGQLVDRVDAHGMDERARKLAAELCAFFEGEARRHHADEERLVFPGLLKSADAKIVHEVKRLQQDHGWLEEDWLAMAPSLHAIEDGITGADMEMLRRALPVFDKLYREHIAMEESMIYPIAKRRHADQSGAEEQGT